MSQGSDQVADLFLAAVELPTDQRSEYLDAACGGDVRLRDRIEGLLRVQPRAERFLESPAPELGSVENLAVGQQPGDSIGPYKLLEQIGEGGFGVVYMAEQTSPVRRKVALKIIKPGMDTRQVVARFEAERQALAMMDHPNIAKILDAGSVGLSLRERRPDRATPGLAEDPERQPHATSEALISRSEMATLGRPYFVMELVPGVPITAYCDDRQLTPRERLQLFLDVCRAVQHAHQKGVIHRDLKPSNVLVTLHDDRAVVKVIDFGVAKAIGEPLTQQTLFTGFGQMIGTPTYMSPEQAQLSGLDVDTRSDVYALGVLLYELITGTTPFEEETLRRAGFDEMRRLIREVDPPRPSERVSTLADDLRTTVADRRRIDPRKLGESLRGELDWIVMKCLEKDRNRRYESVNDLARDIERYLADEPVQACPPSAPYRLKKFVRRNKATAAFIVLLTAAVTAMGVSNFMIQSALTQKNAALALALNNEQRAVTEATKSKAVSDLLRELTQRAMDDYGRVAVESPRDLDRRLNAAVGLVGLIKVCAAAPGFSREVDEVNRRLTAELPQVIAAFPESSECQRLTGLLYRDWAFELIPYVRHLQAAEHAFSKSAEIYNKLSHADPGRPHVWFYLANSYANLGDVQRRLARPDDAKGSFQHALEIYRKHAADITADPLGESSLHVTDANVRLALFLASENREEESAERLHEAFASAKRIKEEVALANALWFTALAQLVLGDEAGYRETCQLVVDVSRSGADDITKLKSIWTLCLGPNALGDSRLPLKHAEECFGTTSLEPRHAGLMTLAAAHFRAGQYRQAVEGLKASLNAYPSDPPPGLDTSALQQLLLAMSLWQLGEHDQARKHFAEAQLAVDEELAAPSIILQRRATLELLRREAESLIWDGASDAFQPSQSKSTGNGPESAADY